MFFSDIDHMVHNKVFHIHHHSAHSIGRGMGHKGHKVRRDRKDMWGWDKDSATEDKQCLKKWLEKDMQ